MGELMAKIPSTDKMVIPSNCILAVVFVLAAVQNNSKIIVKNGVKNNGNMILASKSDKLSEKTSYSYLF